MSQVLGKSFLWHLQADTDQFNLLYYTDYLTLCIQETTKGVLLQMVKTQMKYSTMLHFIRVYTVCKGKKDLQTNE